MGRTEATPPVFSFSRPWPDGVRTGALTLCWVALGGHGRGTKCRLACAQRKSLPSISGDFDENDPQVDFDALR
jgi:hypothetical protein